MAVCQLISFFDSILSVFYLVFLFSLAVSYQVFSFGVFVFWSDFSISISISISTHPLSSHFLRFYYHLHTNSTFHTSYNFQIFFFCVVFCFFSLFSFLFSGVYPQPPSYFLFSNFLYPPLVAVVDFSFLKRAPSDQSRQTFAFGSYRRGVQRQ